MLYFTLAGKVMAIEGLKEEESLRSMREFAPFVVPPSEADWMVRFTEETALPAFEACHEFDFEDGGIHCRFGEAEDSLLFEMTSSSATEVLQLRFDGGDTILATHSENPTILRYALWMSVGMLGMRTGIMPVHSSVVVHRGKAVLCLGESGTGKSTHTRLWREHIEDSHLLNDDSPILTADGEIYGSPWSGKTPCYINRHFPIAAIVRLSQAPKNEIHRLSIIEAIAALQPSLPPSLSQCGKGLDAQLELISQIFMKVPFYHLSCLPDAEAAQLCHKEIFG